MEAKKERVKLLELEPNIVLLFSAIAIPMIILGALLILGTVRSEMNRLVGEDLLGGTAEDTARHLDTYLLNGFTTVSVITATARRVQFAVPVSTIERSKRASFMWYARQSPVNRANRTGTPPRRSLVTA